MSTVKQNNAELTPDELNALALPYDNRIEKVAEQCQNECIDAKQLKAGQKPVQAAANITIALRLKQEAYRAKWRYALRRKQDKWAHRDRVRAVKAARRAKIKADRLARKTARNSPKRGKERV